MLVWIFFGVPRGTHENVSCPCLYEISTVGKTDLLRIKCVFWTSIFFYLGTGMFSEVDGKSSWYIFYGVSTGAKSIARTRLVAKITE